MHHGLLIVRLAGGGVPAAPVRRPAGCRPHAYFCCCLPCLGGLPRTLLGLPVLLDCPRGGPGGPTVRQHASLSGCLLPAAPCGTQPALALAACSSVCFGGPSSDMLGNAIHCRQTGARRQNR